MYDLMGDMQGHADEQVRIIAHVAYGPAGRSARASAHSFIVHPAKTQDGKLLDTLQKGFKFIEEESFSSDFQGLFSEINLGSDKLGRKYDDRNAKLCSIISEIALGMAPFSTDVDTVGMRMNT